MSPAKDNTLSDVQNLLGFLLAGFGGALSFIGLRSTEVTTVLRNNSLQASIVALLLVLSVLAAVIAVAIPSASRIPVLRAVAIFIALLIVGPIVILLIPIEPPQQHQPIFVVVVVLVIALGLLALALLLWDTVPSNLRTKLTSNKRPQDQTTSKRPQDQTISMQLVFIMTSVVLIGASIYGAMRLETVSQLNSDVQLGAQITKSGNDTALTLHVTASKVKDRGYIGISVVGLPSTVDIAADCGKVYVPLNGAPCSEDPCAYLHTLCERVMGETVTPDAAGDIDEKLNDNLITGQFQDIHVQAVVCSSGGTCQSVSQAGSRLDIHLLNFPHLPSLHQRHQSRSTRK